MLFKEIFTLTRPDTSIPFHSPDSIFYCEVETDFTSSLANKYFKENYIDTGKCKSGIQSPTISDDGLTLRIEIIYNNQDALADLYSDLFFNVGYESRELYWYENGIEKYVDVIPLDDDEV